MGVNEVLMREVEEVKAGVLGQSQNFKFLKTSEPQIDSVRKIIRVNVLFMYNSLPIAFTLENYLNTVNPGTVENILKQLRREAMLISKALSMLFNVKIGDAKAYSILYNAGRRFQFVLPVRFVTNKIIEYGCVVRRDKGVLYDNKLRFVNGEISLNNTLVKLNTGMSKVDIVMISLVQNLIKGVFPSLVNNQFANNLVKFITELYRGLGLMCLNDNNFVGTFAVSAKVIYTGTGIDQQKSIITVSKGIQSASVPIVSVISLYNNIKGDSKEKLEEVVKRVYLNQIQ